MSANNNTPGIKIPPDVPEGLQSEERLIRPFDWYDKHRQDESIRFDSSRGVYDIFSYELIKKAFHSPDQFARPDPSLELESSQFSSEDPFNYIGESVLRTDGESQAMMKQSMFEYFTSSVLSEFEPTIAQITEAELAEGIGDQHSFDFVTDFAVPVTTKVPMRLLGIPEKHYQKVLGWLEAFIEAGPTEYSSRMSTSTQLEKLQEMTEYLDGIIKRRTRDPCDDLISTFIHQTPMDAKQIGSNCFEILLANQGTMTDFVSNALYLHDKKDIFSMPEDIESILEEVLRFRSPVQCQSRVTTETVCIGTETIPTDTTVILWIGSANRDPAKFNKPNRFDPSRETDHLAFGHGSHSCIGFTFARIQAPIILRTLIEQFEHIQIHNNESRPFVSPAVLSFEKLPVSVQYG